MTRIATLFVPAVLSFACSDSDGSDVTGSRSGGSAGNTYLTGTAPSSSSGGGTGGTSGNAQAGGPAAFGGTSEPGGANGAGSTTATTGVVAAGGTASGGVTAKGGSSSMGGSSSIGGSSSMGGSSTRGGTLNAGANIRVTESKQTVDGFGFSTAWGSVPSAANLDAFFSTTKGAGLSILRNRIPFRERPGMNDNFMGSGNYTFTTVGNGTSAYKNFTLAWSNWDLAATKSLITTIKANADYQVTSYFSTPWTPPNNSTSKWKLGVADYVNQPDVGGYLDPAHYQDYADVLADYVLGFESNMGVPLSALSLQNEPNFKCNYESADWSAAQLHDFMAVLKTEFTKKGVFTRLPQLTLMAPEHNNMTEALILPTLADSNLSSLVGIVAGHQYEYGWSSDPLSVPAPVLTTSRSMGKRLWMTEWNVDRFLTVAGSYTIDDIYPSIALAKVIHTDFVSHGLNAYIYWWSSALVNGSSPSKVLWTLAQYSRFVRPGWVRVDTSTTPITNVLLSAFVNEGKTQIAVIAVNLGSSSQSFPLTLDSGTFGTMTPYRTSASENLAKLPAIAGGSSTVQVTVPAQSITTYTSSI